MKGPSDLISAGLFKPNPQDWRVRVFLSDGTQRSIRVSPGTLDEQAAVNRALRHMKIIDTSVVSKIESERVEKSVSVAPYGIVHK